MFFADATGLAEIHDRIASVSSRASALDGHRRRSSRDLRARGRRFASSTPCRRRSRVRRTDCDDDSPQRPSSEIGQSGVRRPGCPPRPEWCRLHAVTASTGRVSRDAHRASGVLGESRGRSGISRAKRSFGRVALADLRGDSGQRAPRVAGARRQAPVQRTAAPDSVRQRHRALRCWRSPPCTRACYARRSLPPTRCKLPRVLRHTRSDLRSPQSPALVFAAEGASYEAALRSVLPSGAELVVSSSLPDGLPTTPFAEIEQLPATAAVDEAHARAGPDTVAKILFTSGSTGRPKGVINTQRMLCSNQEMIRCVMPFLADEPPVLCDWLPWNHTAGGNHNFRDRPLQWRHVLHRRRAPNARRVRDDGA